MSAPSTQTETTPAVRSCDGCTLCCKVLNVPELNKPAGRWCKDCAPTTGCRIYEARPNACRAFQCAFLVTPEMPESWRPKRSHFVIVAGPTGRLIAVHCDPQYPRAWREEPYYSYFKRWSAELIERATLLAVYVGKHATAILPDREVVLGVLDGKSLILNKKATPRGFIYDVLPVPEDDPRAVTLKDVTPAKHAT